MSASASSSRSTSDEEQSSDVEDANSYPNGSDGLQEQTNILSLSDQASSDRWTVFSGFTTKASNLMSYVKGFWPMRHIVNMGLYEDKVRRSETLTSSETISLDHRVNRRLSCGQTPLTLAIQRGDITAVSALLANPEVDINYPEKTQYSTNTYIEVPPLIVAVKAGHAEIVEMLLDSGADVNVADSHRCSSLYYAAEQDTDDIFNNILRHNPILTSHEETVLDPLHQACRHGRLNCVKQLIHAGLTILTRKSSAMDISLTIQ